MVEALLITERTMTERTDGTTRRDPLDTLFRPTVAPDGENVRHPEAAERVTGSDAPRSGGSSAAPGPSAAAGSSAGDASAAPHRAEGTRVRAGNAMARTRAALLGGAGRAVATSGTSITMSQVASTAGVAKATLYNHFRTREAVLTALADTEVEALAGRVAGLPLRQAVVEIAAAVSTHPVLATLREREPGVLAAALLGPDRPAALDHAREALEALVAGAGVPAGDREVAADVLLRWLFSLALAPTAPTDVLAAVDLILGGLLAPSPETSTR